MLPESDFATLKPFNGAVAGKVVTLSGDPDIGAPPELSYFPTWMMDEARQFRAAVLEAPVAPDAGLVALTDGAKQAMLTGDARGAIEKYKQAITVSPDDGVLWMELARAILAVSPNDGAEGATLQRDATSSSFNAYQLLRTTATRAEILAVMAAALDRRDMFRPALTAYEASLALVNSASVRAEYEDLKARKGFRVVEHTVDADTPSPRVCAQFSEDLVKAGVDYSTFVTVDGQPPKAVEAKDKQICVEGLEHGSTSASPSVPACPRRSAR